MATRSNIEIQLKDIINHPLLKLQLELHVQDWTDPGELHHGGWYTPDHRTEPTIYCYLEDVFIGKVFNGAEPFAPLKPRQWLTWEQTQKIQEEANGIDLLTWLRDNQHIAGVHVYACPRFLGDRDIALREHLEKNNIPYVNDVW